MLVRRPVSFGRSRKLEDRNSPGKSRYDSRSITGTDFLEEALGTTWLVSRDGFLFDM